MFVAFKAPKSSKTFDFCVRNKRKSPDKIFNNNDHKSITALLNTIYRFAHIHLFICSDWFFFVFLFLFQDDLTGQAILDVCFARLNLIETAYFGLRYLDEENQTVSCLFCIHLFIFQLFAN